jgi:putative AlgH/UPF0301 family transcriptional regulator
VENWSHAQCGQIESEIETDNWLPCPFKPLKLNPVFHDDASFYPAVKTQKNKIYIQKIFF